MTEQVFDIFYDKMNKQFRKIDSIMDGCIEENVDAKYVENQNDDLITKETKIIKAKEFLNNKKNSL